MADYKSVPTATVRSLLGADPINVLNLAAKVVENRPDVKPPARKPHGPWEAEHGQGSHLLWLSPDGDKWAPMLGTAGWMEELLDCISERDPVVHFGGEAGSSVTLLPGLTGEDDVVEFAGSRIDVVLMRAAAHVLAVEEGGAHFDYDEMRHNTRDPRTIIPAHGAADLVEQEYSPEWGVGFTDHYRFSRSAVFAGVYIHRRDEAGEPIGFAPDSIPPDALRFALENEDFAGVLRREVLRS